MTHTRVEFEIILGKNENSEINNSRAKINLLVKKKELAVVFESTISKNDKFKTPGNKDSLIASPGISKLNINKPNLEG